MFKPSLGDVLSGEPSGRSSTIDASSSKSTLTARNSMAVLELDILGPRDMPLYKQDSSRIGDETLFKYLSEMKRPGNFKLQTVRANLRLDVQLVRQDATMQNVLSSSFVPIAPFEYVRSPMKASTPTGSGRTSMQDMGLPPRAPAFVREVELFNADLNDENVSLSSPHFEYKNLLYVYPQALNFSNQTNFSRARNLCCHVELRDSDDDPFACKPLRLIFSRSPPVGSDSEPPSPFVSYTNTGVLHHESNPSFYDEIKLALPALLHDRHHLLFKVFLTLIIS